METIRDIRETKQLSQDKVAAAAGLTYAKFVRIEEGSGKTTQEEIDRVLAILKGMEPGTRKLAGRPFKDPVKQAAVRAAREQGQSVAAALGFVSTAPTEAASGEESPAEEETPKQRKARLARERRAANKNDGTASALAKKAPSRSRNKPKKDEQPDTEQVAQPDEDDLIGEQKPETDVVETGDSGTVDSVDASWSNDEQQQAAPVDYSQGEPVSIDTIMINGVEVEV